MNNPNFQRNLTPEVVAKLDGWYGEGGYEVLMMWSDGIPSYMTYYGVLQVGSRVDCVRIFPIGDSLEISIDERKEVA